MLRLFTLRTLNMMEKTFTEMKEREKSIKLAETVHLGPILADGTTAHQPLKQIYPIATPIPKIKITPNDITIPKPISKPLAERLKPIQSKIDSNQMK